MIDATADQSVAIVGGGIAGLACARVLNDADIDCTLLEAGDTVGGRVRSDHVDGFTLDRGFQVFLTAYPEAPRFLDVAALRLNVFDAGAKVRIDGTFYNALDPLRHPARGLASVLAPVGRFSDKLRVIQFRRRVEMTPSATILERPGKQTIDHLAELKFSSRMVERFFRPFFGGVFCERELKTSSRVFDFTFKMFAQGRAALPTGGMGQIPAQMAASLSRTHVALGAQVTDVTGGMVHLVGGQRVKARAVIIATESNTAARLLPTVKIPRTRHWASSTTLYFAAQGDLIERPILMLNGTGTGIVNSVADLSSVSSSYAPAGQSLISVSVIGKPTNSDDELQQAVRAELRAWFGNDVMNWRYLRAYRISHALPDQSPEAEAQILPSDAVFPGVFVCGDYCDTASINGAMASGRRTAEAVIRSLA